MPDDRMPGRAGPLPPTATRPELLKDGTDTAFRQLVWDMLTVSANMQAVRDRLAAALGVSGPQYAIIMAVARLQGDGGATVGAVARQIHVTGAFVTAEARKLVERGLLRKRADERDRRVVRLLLTPACANRLEAIGPRIRAMNDTMFGSLSAADFERLRTIVASMVEGSRRAANAAL